MKRFYLLSVICFLSTGIFAQENTGEERTLSADSIITSDARLDSIYQSLPEVMITGERPVVKASQGKLVYDLPRLIHDLPVDNAYDAVKELPGVTEMNGGLQLAGQGVTVVLNGKVTTLSTEQLYALLRSIPASRIEKAEVMYNAPARYQVRGALINVQLKQTTDGPASWQGELYAKYNQKHYENFEERASLLYNGNKFSIDFLYSHKHGRTYNTTDKDAMHTLADGSVHPMTTGEVKMGRSHTHDFRVGTDYNIAKEHQLSFVYNGNYQTTGTTGTLIKKALEEKHPEIKWDITILKSGPLGGDQQIGSRIVEGEIDYLFFFTDPMTLQPHDTDVKALTRLAGVENIVFCCNRSTADHIITSPLFTDPTYERIHPDYTNYTQRFENKGIISEAVEQVKKRRNKSENNISK